MTNYLDLAAIALRIIEKSMTKPITRKSFLKSTKNLVLKNQKYRCKACGKKSKVWDFDHINGDNSNNSISNCQALCPTCHAEKTRKIKQNSLKLSKIIKTMKSFLKD